jgi:magnesium-transporting ATPase (P-type)
VALRNGKEEQVHYDNIAVGEVIKIKAGMNVPVDGVVIKAADLTVNESAMTGESDELKKESLEACRHRLEEKESEYASDKNAKRGPHDVPSPVLLSGTQIATGEGYFITIMIGKHSCKGKILAKLEQRIETTPL